MAEKKRTSPRLKTKIEIPLESAPRYVRGSAPRVGPITLAPPRDSTAYIIDKYVLPTIENTTPTSRRLIHYHIGWTDDPAARIDVPCDKIMDYVSPRELEDWEHDNFEKLEAEKAEEARRAAAFKKAGGSEKRHSRPGRPPKDRQQKHQPEPAPVPALTAADEAMLLAKKVSGPSLSTPQKPKVERLSDLDHTSADDGYDSMDQAKLPLAYTTSVRAVTSVLPPLRSPGPIAKVAKSFNITPQAPVKSPKGPDTILRALGPASNTPSTTPRVHPAYAQAVGLQASALMPETITPFRAASPWVPAGSAPSGFSRNPNSLTPAFPSTPVPVPSVPGYMMGPASRSTPSGSAASSSSARKRTSPSVAENAAHMPKSANTPADNKKRRTSHGSSKKPSPADGDEEDKDADDTGATEGEEDDVYVVNALLDDRQIIAPNGRKTAEYLVRWDGDWPPGQKETWEPAANIQDKNLIRRYQRRKKAGKLPPPPAQPPAPPPPPPPPPKGKSGSQSLLSFMPQRKKYNNVAEAFEGGVDMDEHGPDKMCGRGGDDDKVDDEEEEEDELRVMDDEALGRHRMVMQGKQIVKTTPAFGGFDEELERYQHRRFM
ncbi:hypothetical protein B0T17DRAFT_252698 [Bombardia bombarda]|uniref:Chromo domain-containing protein n=1 Tax=Bombardia bombarda TaxID=252184 RepID=A0AA40C4H6_9PEZI|nr:hypothetical protein B0T17DRAFT_252698 [Bombardia bombarda]